VSGPDVVGWIATAVFTGSYFCRRSQSLRRLQAFGASLWLAYGVLMGAAPVVVANLIVASVALYSSWREGVRS
jgi:hypothetical protein